MTRSYHHGDLRRALIDAGLDLLDQGGVEALGVRAAARAVGVSHAAPVRHFPDMASYLAAIAVVGYGQLADAMDTARAKAPDPLEAFRVTGLAYVAFATKHPNRFRLLSHPLLADKSHDPELAAASARAFAVLSDVVAAAQDDGGVRAAPVEDVALAAWSLVHGLATLVVDDQLRAKGYKAKAPALAVTVLDQLYLGLCP